MHTTTISVVLHYLDKEEAEITLKGISTDPQEHLKLRNPYELASTFLTATSAMIALICHAERGKKEFEVDRILEAVGKAVRHAYKDYKGQGPGKKYYQSPDNN